MSPYLYDENEDNTDRKTPKEDEKKIEICYQTIIPGTLTNIALN